MTPSFSLLIITDEAPDVVARVERALAGAPPGRVAVQLRDKTSPAGEILRIAIELRAVTRAFGAQLLVNDRVDVALAVAADGVQLPERGLPPDVARALLGPGKIVGCSCHDRAGLVRAAVLGADYATLSPVRDVPRKGRPLGLDGFAALARDAPLPIYALGGVTAADVPVLRAAGAHGVAVIREVMAAADAPDRVAALLAAR